MAKEKPKADWVELSTAEIEKIVVDLGKKGTTPAMIGQILRDQYGVPRVKEVVGKSVTKMLVEGGIKIDYPEDLLALIKRAVSVRKHLATNKSDKHNRTSLSNTESKIRRLVKYYVKEEKLPKGWKYDPDTATLLVK